MKQVKRSACNHIRHFSFHTSHLRQHRRATTKHKSFVFYLSSISSSSIIVFNQQHRWVAHSTSTPCKKIIQSPILSSPPRQFRRAHASLHKPTSQSPSFHPPRHTIKSQSCPRLLHVLHGYNYRSLRRARRARPTLRRAR